MFDPNQFLDQQVEGANDTRLIPVPEGEYLAIVEKVSARQWQSKQDPSKAGVTLDVVWSIEDQSVKEFLGRSKVTVNQGIMLDTTDEGKLDMGKGKNVGLGRLREAVGLNDPGRPFAFTQFPGLSAKVLVKHRLHEDNVYAEVKGVTKI